MSLDFTIDNKELCTLIRQPEEFNVISTPFTYRVQFIDEIYKKINDIIKNEKRVIVLIDEKVYSLYFKEKNIFEDVPVIQIPATENNKDINTVLSIIDELEGYAVDKSDTILVIGGGILQDLGAFVSAIYKRGIPWIYIPTTLLSQADSCVGGKTAINYNKHKNILALFSAPKAVYICVDFLNTLTQNDIYSGMGEIIRLYLTGGNDLYKTMERKTMIYESLMIKRAVVEQDEFEKNIRKSMNYGHSIGHALEGCTKYDIPHGIAVMFGILVENEISSILGYLSSEDNVHILNMMRSFLSIEYVNIFKSINNQQLLSFMYHDKKMMDGILKFPLLLQPGKMKIIDLNMQEHKDVILDAITHIKENL